MSHPNLPTFTCFDGDRRISSGLLADVAIAFKRVLSAGAVGPVLIFDDSTGRTIDVDTRGSEDDVARRLGTIGSEPHISTSLTVGLVQGPNCKTHDAPRGRGRPKLGVIAREVTLLPRHWDWLTAQPGGASVTLRKLVEVARRIDAGADSTKKKHERAYHFMSAIAGDFPGFEESSRALFANDRFKFDKLIGAWPKDIREHLILLAFGELM